MRVLLRVARHNLCMEQILEKYLNHSFKIFFFTASFETKILYEAAEHYSIGDISLGTTTDCVKVILFPNHMRGSRSFRQGGGGPGQSH